MTASRVANVSPISPAVLEVAAEWWARQASGAMNDAQRLELATWLAGSTEHERAWEQLQLTWRALDAVQHSPRVDVWRSEARDFVSRGRYAFIAAAASVLAAMGVLWVMGKQEVPTVAVLPAWSTAVGEVQTKILDDGTQLTLGTKSSVRIVAWDRSRIVALDQGEAYFVVAKDEQRPFTVVANELRVTAVGTEFSVRRDTDRAIVLLKEGRVRLVRSTVSGAAQSRELAPGDQAIVTADSWVIGKANVDRLTQWREGRLAFDGEPLAHVVAELNRYSKTPLVLTPALNKTPISGVFRTGDNLAFAHTLHGYGIARVRAANEQAIELEEVRNEVRSN